MTYTVVSKSDLTRFERNVNKLILKGYEPIGGVAIKFYYRSQGDNIQSYFQAMVRHEPTTTR